jgi:hypothetical protein
MTILSALSSHLLPLLRAAPTKSFLKFNPVDLPKSDDLPSVADISDWLLFYYRLPQLLGDMHRFVL